MVFILVKKLKLSPFLKVIIKFLAAGENKNIRLDLSTLRISTQQMLDLKSTMKVTELIAEQ